MPPDAEGGHDEPAPLVEVGALLLEGEGVGGKKALLR